MKIQFMAMLTICVMAICGDAIAAGSICGTVATYNYLMVFSSGGERIKEYVCTTLEDNTSTIGNLGNCICLTYDATEGTDPNGTIRISGCRNYLLSSPTTSGCLTCQSNEYKSGYTCTACPANSLGSNNGQRHANTSCAYCVPGYEKNDNGECVKKVSCSWTQYFNGTSCSPCPANSYGAYESYYSHSETECGYCDNNYYWVDSQKRCLPCPDGGVTSGPAVYANYHVPITSCYLAVGNYEDDSGSFSITSRCFYKN